MPRCPHCRFTYSPRFLLIHTCSPDHGQQAALGRIPQKVVKPAKPVIVGANRSIIPGLPPDLDAMRPDQLRSWVAKYDGKPKLLFPTQPRNFTGTTKILVSMARMKLQGDLAGYDAAYERLEPYCQWRRLYNIMASVAPGKKFRRFPPNKQAEKRS